MISVDLLGKFSQLCDEELYDSLRSAHQSHPKCYYKSGKRLNTQWHIDGKVHVNME